MKKTKGHLALIVAFVLVAGSALPVYAGGHHGRGGTTTPKATWHDATDYYDGHYSNQCVRYDHVLHKATAGCAAHYSYECTEYDNCVWRSDSKTYRNNTKTYSGDSEKPTDPPKTKAPSYRDNSEKPADPPKAKTPSYRGLRGGCCGGAVGGRYFRGFS
ncbi:MAG: hypothetical protein LBI54_04900 [Lachnospiraceae bacterium]|jgi:hypothetical protein|nr:hypothetical protein [Lachnospiraceae bacterium]